VAGQISTLAYTGLGSQVSRQPMSQNSQQFSAGPRLSTPPLGDPSREAVASLRGYAYQLYSSALAWMDLQPQDELYLEVSEDYAVAAEGALRAVQVKDTGPSTVTINSEGIRDAIDSFVGLVQLNPHINIFVRYLSTSPIGRERAAADRAAGKPTLEYWRLAAMAADVAPLRKILLAVGLSERVQQFINERDDQALRDEFLKRLQWDCGQPDLRVIQDTLTARLTRFCSEKLGLYADDGEQLVGTVLMHILNTIVQVKPRRLDHFDLRKLLENATTIRVPRSAANAIIEAAVGRLAGQPLENAAIIPIVLATEADLPLPRILAARRNLLDQVTKRVHEHGAVIITGSSGRGKTTIARLASRELGGDSRVVDLRNASALETITKLRQAALELSATRSRAVILDDLNEANDPNVWGAWARLLSTARRNDIVCLITAYNPPSGRALTEAGLNPSACVAVPDLSLEEVQEMVVAGEGHPKWAQTVYFAGAFGHPQLVNALVSGLRARAWPDDELKRLQLFERSADVEAERIAARRQLVAAVPDKAKALLYRVSLMIGRFDRPIVLSLAELQPSIDAPGQQLDLLIGPWIEPFAQLQFRVSPLVANAGEETLAPAEQISVHRAVAEAYTAGNVFNIGKADATFLHALRGKSEAALLKLAIGVLMAKQSVRKDLAEWITGIRLHRTDRPIFGQEARLSVLLRLAQLVLRAPARERESIKDCWDALQREIAEAAPAHPELEMFALGKALCDVSLAALLPDWIDLILRFDELTRNDSNLIAAFNHPVEDIKKPTVVGMLFLLQAAGIDSVAELKAVFDRLESLPAERRADLLANAAELPSDFALFVNHAWLAEHRRSIDWQNCARLYLEMAKQAERWGYRQLALRCYIARGVMLDEYVENPEGALAALDDAEESLGADPALSRARAKVYYRRKDHASALALLRDSADKTARNDHIEQAFMFREAGISAAETGDWVNAARWFNSAQSAASEARIGDMAMMAIGLVADHGIAEFQAGNLPKAIECMSNALAGLGQFDAASSLRAGYLHRVVRHAVLCIQLRVTGKRELVPDQPMAIVPGMCSNPEPSDVSDLPLGHIDIAWYLLAEAEIAGDAGTAVVDSLRGRLGGKTIPIFESNLRGAQIGASIRDSDPQRFLANLHAWVEALFFVQRLGQNFRQFSPLNPTYGEIESATPNQFKSPDGEYCFTNAVLEFGIAASLQNRPETLQDLYYRISELSYSNELKQLAGFMAGTIEKLDHVESELAGRINQVANRAGDLEPDDVFVAALRMVQFVARSTLKSYLTPILADWLRKRWMYAVTEQTFLLRNPGTNIPAIKQLLGMQEHSIEYCAHFLATVAPAAKTRLTESFREYLANLSMLKSGDESP
jgi:hypothetical protein